MTIKTTWYRPTDRKITLGVYPTRYGNNNVTEAFENKELGFELEVRNFNSVLRNILTLDEVLNLQEQINTAIDAYNDFMEREE
jgi:hypothetical protein